MHEKIKIVHEDSRLLVPGETIRVPVEVHFDSRTKVRGIRAEFRAAEKTRATYTTTTTDHKGRVKTVTKTATEHVDFVRKEHLLFGNPKQGFFSTLGDAVATLVGGGKHELIEPGTHEFEVELTIPANAPMPFKGKKCEVFYQLSVGVDLPLRIDWRSTHQFAVAGTEAARHEPKPAHVRFPEDDASPSFWDKTFGKDVTLNLAVDRNALSPGETANGMLTIESTDTFEITETKLVLACQEKVVARGHSNTYTHRIPLDNIDASQTVTGQSIHRFEVTVPDELTAPYSGSGTNFDVQWFVEVTLKIPWAKDSVIRLPLVVQPPA